MRELGSSSRASQKTQAVSPQDDQPASTYAGPSISTIPVSVSVPLAVAWPGAGELTRLIEKVSLENTPAYLLIVHDIFQRTAESVAHAKEASVAVYNLLCRTPVSLCLRVIRLWALMLRYCSSENFVYNTSRKGWLRAVKLICLSQDQHHWQQAVRDRAMEVVAGARYAFPTNPGFRILWLRVKRHADPEEGVPFSNPIFYLPETQCKFASDIAADPKLHAAAVHRLVVAHDTAQNRAQRLNKLLDGGVLNDKAGIIMDVHDKCVASRDIIQSRLPWAIVNAERPIERLADDHNGGKHPKRRVDRGDQPSEAQLLSMLLEAKEALNDVLRRHEAETATPEAAFPSPPSSPDHRPSRTELSHLPASAQPSRSGDSAAAPAPEPPIPPPAPIHRLQRFPSSATARFEHASPPPYSLLEDGHSQESTVQASASHVDIGSALPPSILSYLTDRRVPRGVLRR